VPVITLIGKPGCHLCDEARETVAGVVDALLGEPDSPAVTVEELSILDDPELSEKYWEEIPVVLVDGRMHSFWRVDPDRLAAALRTAPASPSIPGGVPAAASGENSTPAGRVPADEPHEKGTR